MFDHPNIRSTRTIAAIIVLGISTAFAPSAFASTIPVNYIGTNFAPITTATSSTYDFSTGATSSSAATSTAFSNANQFERTINTDPPAQHPNGFGTFIGTAKPINGKQFGYNGAVLYEQSVCPVSATNCLSTNPSSFTFGVMVDYSARGLTLDHLNSLQALWLAQSGSNGGGSPRFQIGMSDGKNIFVYFGHYPSFAGESPATWTAACPTDQCGPTNNMASDNAGLRWDSSQIGGTFYGTYSEAVTLANAQGLTINNISVVTDGGWSNGNVGTADGQTFLFQSIQYNQQTRFP